MFFTNVPQYELIESRYPRLLAAMMKQANLTKGESIACIIHHLSGMEWSGEAVNHYGGIKRVLKDAITRRNS